MAAAPAHHTDPFFTDADLDKVSIRRSQIFLSVCGYPGDTDKLEQILQKAKGEIARRFQVLDWGVLHSIPYSTRDFPIQHTRSMADNPLSPLHRGTGFISFPLCLRTVLGPRPELLIFGCPYRDIFLSNSRKQFSICFRCSRDPGA